MDNKVIDHRNTLWYVYRRLAEDAVIEIKQDDRRIAEPTRLRDASPPDEGKPE